MLFRDIFLILVVVAFSALGVTLFAVAWWSSLPQPKSKTTVAPARRPDEAQSRRKTKAQA